MQYDISVSNEQRSATITELQNHMESLAKATIKAAPGKKMMGQYYKSWYRYPTLKVDLVSYHYFTWKNYSGDIIMNYENATLGDFRWNSFTDDTLE
ncbi:hypothetical protein [Gorillibacterium massiliense]|uniref:hypothetical protein n=1 Tax=Gorillibacterium massiliense TaxID=1280390 RepID=UPI0012DD2D43|nr:hypothetical protein [Gorillibacterium massiliense]